MRTTYILAVNLLVLLLLAACSERATERQLPLPARGAEDTALPPLAESGGDVTVKTGDAKTEFEALMKKGELSTYMVRYQTRDSISGQGELVMYLKDGKSRMDTTTVIEGQSIEGRIYALRDEFISCQRQEGEWTCFRIESAEADAALPKAFKIEEPDADFVKRGTRTVAGTATTCYEMTITLPDFVTSSTEYCIAKEGVILYLSSKTQGYTTTWEATEYATSVSDSAFTPPVKAMSMEEMMQQYAGGFDPSAYQ